MSSSGAPSDTGDGSGEGDSTSAGEGEADSSTSIDEESGTTTGADGSSDGGEGEESSGGDSSGAEGSDSGGSDESTTGAQPGELIVSALAVPGGLDRLKIFGLDTQAGTCTIVVLVYPMPGNGGSVIVPQGWMVESAGRSDDISDCGEPGPPEGSYTDAVMESGSVQWVGPIEPFPCKLDLVDVFLEMGAEPDVVVEADNLAVQGC